MQVVFSELINQLFNQPRKSIKLLTNLILLQSCSTVLDNKSINSLKNTAEHLFIKICITGWDSKKGLDTYEISAVELTKGYNYALTVCR